MWRKKLADGLTATRFFLALILVWLGFSQGAAGLPLAVAVLLVAWIIDGVDGSLARSSGAKAQTWVGAHDLAIDAAMGTAALVYLERAGFVDGRVAIAYLVTWAIIFWRLRGLLKSFAALFQAPIYAWFLWTSLQQAPEAGLWLVLYVVVYVGLAWRHLLHTGLPELLRGLQKGLIRFLARARGSRPAIGHETGGPPRCGEEPPVDDPQSDGTVRIRRSGRTL
jgi:phosphatidylglycerophosphate synthase